MTRASGWRRARRGARGAPQSRGLGGYYRRCSVGPRLRVLAGRCSVAWLKSPPGGAGHSRAPWCRPAGGGTGRMAGRCRQTPLINANALPFSPPHGRREDPRAGTSTANHRARRAASAEPSYFVPALPPPARPRVYMHVHPAPHRILVHFHRFLYSINTVQYSSRSSPGARPIRRQVAV